jgi:hypothetical protein
MGVGHLAAGLGLSSADRRTNAGWFVLGALLADILLGIFVLSGLEEVHISPSFARRHYFEFTFPYSHGLLATIVWAILAAGLARAFAAWKTALLMAGAVASHFVLDWMVHVPELPLAGEESRKFGLGLWDAPATAIAVEAAVVAAGLALYARAARRARWPMVGYVAVLTPVAIARQWLMTSAPPIPVLAWNWIIGSILLSAIAYGIDRLRMGRSPAVPVDPSR